MTFRQAAILLVGSALVGCKPATPDAATSSAVGVDSAVAQARPATATSGCRTVARDAEMAQRKTPIRICAEPGVHEMSNTTARPYGFVVATLENRGNVADDRWALEPGKMYFLRVFRARPTETEDGYYEISSMTGTSFDPPVAKGHLVHCTGPKHPPQQWAHAGFSTCDNGQPKEAEDPLSGDPPVVSDAQGTGGPAWITCAEGCCTTDAI